MKCHGSLGHEVRAPWFPSQLRVEFSVGDQGWWLGFCVGRFCWACCLRISRGSRTVGGRAHWVLEEQHPGLEGLGWKAGMEGGWAGAHSGPRGPSWTPSSRVLTCLSPAWSVCISSSYKDIRRGGEGPPGVSLWLDHLCEDPLSRDQSQPLNLLQSDPRPSPRFLGFCAWPH